MVVGDGCNSGLTAFDPLLPVAKGNNRPEADISPTSISVPFFTQIEAAGAVEPVFEIVIPNFA
jgi:hypothetical protein